MCIQKLRKKKLLYLVMCTGLQAKFNYLWNETVGIHWLKVFLYCQCLGG